MNLQTRPCDGGSRSDEEAICATLRQRQGRTQQRNAITGRVRLVSE